MNIAKMKSALAAMAVIGVLTACGSEPPPPPPPVQPPAPPTEPPPAGGGVVGRFLENPSPGTPLYQTPNPQAYQAMATNLIAQGQAVIAERTTIQYSVQPGNPAVWTQTGQPQPAPTQTGVTYHYYADGYHGSDIQIRLYSPILGSRWFHFVPRYSLHGLILESTDQVALFESSNGPVTLLKIAYGAPNPVILAFTIDSLWNGVYYGGFYPGQPGYGMSYLVTTEVITTSLQYPQYPQNDPGTGGYF